MGHREKKCCLIKGILIFEWVRVIWEIKVWLRKGEGTMEEIAVSRQKEKDSLESGGNAQVTKTQPCPGPILNSSPNLFI